ncbi:formimidoylglutamase [Deferribacter autotrophicus]|uniref:Formimidoylglutamase n=1 Tax=Deferribacter autotrophicus TaxID=500465 RepID=A0A5A8F589_9BACT|nr:formimidoylglutamase [Deferribacter autotrophicus]KAA0257017.1 formimidoylglutamase [Deferribacter autotrophicus]
MCEYKYDSFKWSGRVDSTSDFTAFRWHQVIKQINLDKIDKIQKPSIILLGFCCDEGVKRNKGRVGAKDAPAVIRKYLASLPWHWEDLNLFDAGDIFVDDGRLEDGQQMFSEKVKKIKSVGAFPIVLGGGHEVAYGTFGGVKKIKPAIINFDAHFDNRPYENGASSGTMFAQIADEIKESYKYLCIGIQKSGNTKLLFERNKEFGGECFTAEEVFNNLQNVINGIKKFLETASAIYTTVCMDVFSSSVACGVSAPVPFGILPNHFLFCFEKIAKTGKLIAFDIAEVNPSFDVDDRTARLAAHIIFHVVDNIAKWGYQ